jgi:hypothetical protein
VGPRTLAERLANTREASALADRLEDPHLSFQAARFGSHAAMEAGDLVLADRLLDQARERAEQLGQPILHWYYVVTRAKQATITGSPIEAERAARAACDAGRRIGQPDAPLWLVIQLFVIKLLQGTLADMPARPLQTTQPDALASGAFTSPNRSGPMMVGAFEAAIASEVGRLDDARGLLEALMHDDLRDLPYGWTALVIPAAAGIACARLGHARHAATLFALLEPYAGQFVDSGPSWFGATTHHLANLSRTLGRLDEADAFFADAAGAYARLGASAWLIRARLDWARMLRARGRASDEPRVRELLTDALAAAHELGLTGAARAAAALASSAAG